jgi:hypothetical protein
MFELFLRRFAFDDEKQVEEAKTQNAKPSRAKRDKENYH